MMLSRSQRPRVSGQDVEHAIDRLLHSLSHRRADVGDTRSCADGARSGTRVTSQLWKFVYVV